MKSVIKITKRRKIKHYQIDELCSDKSFFELLRSVDIIGTIGYI